MDIMGGILVRYWTVFPLVFLAGLIDAIAGGGGLISLPAYMLAGLPSHLAIGTNKMSSTMGTALSTYRYAREGYIELQLAVSSVAMALAGSWIGSNLSLLISNRMLRMMMLVVLPVTAYFVLRTRNLEAGREPYGTRRTQIICGIVAFAVGIYDGLYGPGTGTFLILLLTVFAHLPLRKANGLTKAINLTTNITALTVFLLHGQVLLPLGFMAGVCNIAGNYLGVTLFNEKGQKIARPVMLGVVAVFFVRILTELIAG